LPPTLKTKKTVALITAAACSGGIFLAWAIDYFCFEGAHPLHSIGKNTGKNGLWLRYFWYAGKETDLAQWDAMAKRLIDHQIKYAYFHMLTTAADGKLRSHHLDRAQKITSFVHKRAPETQVIAWVYIGSPATPDQVDLSKPAVRAALIQEMHWLTQECGFDGVQWDYEFCASGDLGFVELMKESKAALAPDKLLCTATPMWYPNTLWGWDDKYFHTVASVSDQIAVMCYDSYFYSPSAYVWLLREQALHATTACEGTKCRVILGLPTYEDVTLSHHSRVESLRNALRGVYEGIHDDHFNDTTFDGIALFADYTTDEQEWQDYDRYWLGSSGAGHTQDLPGRI